MKEKDRLSDHVLYGLWEGMKKRTLNKNYENYHCYGGRGIGICDEWIHNPKSFIEWALNNGYEEGLELDREDNNKGYSPENCRWATKSINMLNRQLLQTNNTSGYRCVFYNPSGSNKKPWFARVYFNKRKYYLGKFKTAQDAAFAYDQFVIKNNTGQPLNNLYNGKGTFNKQVIV